MVQAVSCIYPSITLLSSDNHFAKRERITFMEWIDLRSDTVSHPTPAMREAMANATVGDDVFGDDPTVIQLEADAAAMFGKEAGLLVTSGTQGNLLAVMSHCQGRGEEAIIGDKSHIFVYEQGAIAQIAGVVPHTVPVQNDGTLSLDAIKSAIRGNNIHFPRTRMVAIENTQNNAGGVALTPEYTHQVVDLAHKHNLKMHIDGARIFNAIAVCNTTPAEMVGDADSITFCLSKGLSAPVGSVLVGDKAFIGEARRLRKALGGGMRQAGVLAAAGLIAIHEMSKRLHEDHENAALLAEGLSEVNGLRVTNQNTNFVFIELSPDAKLDSTSFVAAMRERKILITGYPNTVGKFRLVTHYWISRERVSQVIDAMNSVLS
jgi:threonine aldolase